MKSLQGLTDTGTRLSNLDFSGGYNPSLYETTQFQPEMLQTYTDTLRKSLTPGYQSDIADMKNYLAETGGLTASTSGNMFDKLNTNFENNMAINTGNAGLTMATNALQNRISIANMGIGALGTAGTLGVNYQNNLNNFNLQNYENQVANQLYQDQNKSGGWMGALTGGIGGAALGTGLAVAATPFTAGASLAYLPAAMGAGVLGGGLLGGLGNNTTGNMVLQGGVGAGTSAMNNLRTPTTNKTPITGSVATTNPYNLNDILFNNGQMSYGY